jgi:hypothetical protein
LQSTTAGELGNAARASIAIASDQEVIDPKYDTCTKQGAQQGFKKVLTADVHRQVGLAECHRIAAVKND